MINTKNTPHITVPAAVSLSGILRCTVYFCDSATSRICTNNSGNRGSDRGSDSDTNKVLNRSE